MSFPLDDQLLGPRDWGARPSCEGVILHTTEYADATRASATQCARDQAKRTATGGWAQPGSYNFIVYDGGVLLTVKPQHASGGINPASEFWNPEPWLRDMLGAEAFRDPTMHHLQISFSGRAAHLSEAAHNGRKWALDMIRDAARIILWAERRDWAADNLVVSGHVHWQDNRTDPGAGVLDFVLDAYEKLVEPTPDDSGDVATTDWKAVAAQRLKTIKRLRIRLSDAESKIIAAREALDDGTDQ